jgi:dTDP-4-dehydrorhamnose reductase
LSKKIVILGVSGTLGHVLFDYFQSSFDVYGLTRDKTGLPFEQDERVYSCGSAQEISNWESRLKEIRPDVIINAVGIIKQKKSYGDSEQIYINSYFPHKLSEVADRLNSRFIHISTDCIFDGVKGAYDESDSTYATDIYGKSKLMGEVIKAPHLTIRTSIIGHELTSQTSLLEWFLSQESNIKGYYKAYFSGFPTISLAKIIDEYFLDRKYTGLYHVSSSRTSKFSLLQLIKKVYKKEIDITKSEELSIDRSLCCDKFKNESGFSPLTWQEYLEEMRKHFINCEYYKGRNETI